MQAMHAAYTQLCSHSANKCKNYFTFSK